jgi:Ca2+/Na+ antiporter
MRSLVVEHKRMENFVAVVLLMLLIIFVVWVIRLNSKDKDKHKNRYVPPASANNEPDRGPLWTPGFRGALGSPGTSPKIVGPHNVHCECAICLYDRDPDKRDQLQMSTM